MSTPKTEKELWKLVVRMENKVIADNLSHDEGSEQLLKSEIKNKVLVPMNYIFRFHPSMGWVWV